MASLREKYSRSLFSGVFSHKLPPEGLHRLVLWLDSNSDFFGAYENTPAQSEGRIVRPSLE